MNLYQSYIPITSNQAMSIQMFVFVFFPLFFFTHWFHNKITKTITIFPLPYHISAFDLCEASYIIRQFNSTKYLDFVTNLYMNFDSIDTPNVEGKTRYEIRDVIYSTMVQPYGVSRSIYNQQMQSVDLWNSGRYSFKYAVSRNVFGTPSFFVNGVQLANLDDPSFDNLKKIFDSLLSK